MVVKMQDLDDGTTLTPNDAKSFVLTADAYEGYIPLCIVGLRNLSTPSSGGIVDFYKGGSNTLNVRIVNNTATNITVKVRFYTLYVKSAFA